MARLITWNFRSMSRTFWTSRIQREVSHAHGQSGSNQKSTLAGPVSEPLLEVM